MNSIVLMPYDHLKRFFLLDMDDASSFVEHEGFGYFQEVLYLKVSVFNRSSVINTVYLSFTVSD